MATASERAMTKILLDKFNKEITPMQNASKAKASEFSGIKNAISNISASEYTPVGEFQTTADEALNSAYQSSAWLAADDATDQIQAIQTQCEALGALGITQAIDKIGSGVMEGSLGAAGDAIEAAKIALGKNMPEFGIGEMLSDLVNKGVTAVESVGTEFSGTLSAILETGKGVEARAKELTSQLGGVVTDAVGFASKGLSTLSGPLKDLDKIIDCVNTIGGAEFVTELDEMVDSMNIIYDDLGVNDDPLQDNFGEFNADTFFDDIAGITTDQKENILKATNMYDKSKNNSEATVTAAKKKVSSEISESSLGGGDSPNVEAKKQETATKAKVVFVSDPLTPIAPPGSPPIPPTPGRTTEPTPATVSYTSPSVPIEPQPTGKSYWTFAEQPIIIDEPSMTEYLFYDPGRSGYADMFKQLWEKMPNGSTTIVSSNRISLGLTVDSFFVDEIIEPSDTPSGFIKWTRITTNFTIRAFKLGESYTTGLRQRNTYEFNGKSVDSSNFKSATATGLASVAGRVVSIGIRDQMREWFADEFDTLLE